MYKIRQLLKRFTGTFRRAQTLKLGGVDLPQINFSRKNSSSVKNSYLFCTVPQFITCGASITAFSLYIVIVSLTKFGKLLKAPKDLLKTTEVLAFCKNYLRFGILPIILIPDY